MQTKENTQITIVEAATQVLNTDFNDERQRMHQLAWVCLADTHIRPNNIVGDKRTLPEDLYQRILTTLCEALVQNEPSPLPEGNTIPGSVLFEALAFREIVLQENVSTHISEELIEHWLPSVLICPIDNRIQVVLSCHRIAQAITERAVAIALSHEAQNSTNAFFAREIPFEVWGDQLSAHVTELVLNEALQTEGRAALLNVLCQKSLSQAEDVAQRLLSTFDSQDYIAHPLHRAAVEALLVANPDRVWIDIEEMFEQRGSKALTALQVIYERHQEDHIALHRWPAQRLLSLARMLYIAYPPDDDPDSKAGRVTAEHLCRQLRDRIPQWLHDRPEELDCRNALQTLASELPRVHLWYQHMTASHNAKQVLRRTLPVAEIIRVLDSQYYRMIRTVEDLHFALIEELERIQHDINEHLPLLYDKERKRLYEEALQAYLYCRLNDRLCDRILSKDARIAAPNPPVLVIREPQVQYRRRYDIHISAPTIHGDIAKVVIEVKWSDNPTLQHSLRKQLCEEYLVNGRLTHGIFLVGWNTKPTKWGPTKDKPETPDALLGCLSKQADECERAYPYIKISPLVFDLRWPEKAL